ncbi:MAG: GNAT family N-acetyltransferase [Trueperaceae bacterium]|nr:GNAT family N-acetyltransferase [Trueperaceae bacterium]
MSIVIKNLHPDYFDALAQLQYDCFPHVAPEEYFNQTHFKSHYQVFPEGSFVALDGERVVGFASGLFQTLEFDQPQHSLMEVTANGSYKSHDPVGHYYYAVDLGVHPDYRNLGIGRQFYDYRKALVKRHAKKGIVAGAVPINYQSYKDQLSPESYIEKVASREIYDATLSFQLNNGFKLIKLLHDYVENEFANSAALIYWENPDYKA